MKRHAIWLAFVGLCASPGAAEWNTGVGGNAARDGRSSYLGPRAADLLWNESVPAIVAQQAVIGGDLVVVARISSFDIPTGTWIVAHELLTGDIRWQIQLPENFPGSSWRSRVSAIRDGQVYATRAGNTESEYLYALDPADGSILWMSEDVIDESTTESLAFADDGDLIVGNFTSLMRIDRVTGATVWSSPRSCPTTDGCAAAVFGSSVYIWEASPSGPIVSVFDLETGAFRYSSVPRSPGLIQQLGLLVGPDGTLYAPRTANNPVTDFFVAYDDTGTALVERWRQPMGYTPFASFGIGLGGSVYTYDRNQRVLRLDSKSGTILDMSMPIAGDFFQPRMAIDAAGKVFVTNGSFDGGELFVFDAELDLVWQKSIPNVNLGGPALGPGGVLVVCGTGSNVSAYLSRRPACPEDLDDDGSVAFGDLLILLSAWGPCRECPEDLDGDGQVAFDDLLLLLSVWGPCPA